MEKVIKAKLPENAIAKLLSELNSKLGSPSHIEYEMKLNKTPIQNLSDINMLPNDELEVNIEWDNKLVTSYFKQRKDYLIGKIP